MDQTTLLLIFVAVLAVVALLFLLRPQAKPDRDAEGDRVEDAVAAAVEDVGGEFLGVDAHPDLPPALGAPDELTRLKGLGPKAAAQLNALGLTRYDQLAALTPDQQASIDARMGSFKGRLARDRWTEQARHLADGDTAGFEAKFGKLGSGA